MSEQTERNELIEKITELHKNFVIVEESKRALISSWLDYASVRCKNSLTNIDIWEGERQRHLASYEYAKPKLPPIPEEELNAPKLNPKTEIENERLRAKAAHEKKYYTPWMVLSIIVTVLCCIGALVLGVMAVLATQDGRAGLAMMAYVAATVLAIRSVIVKNPRSKHCAKSESIGLLTGVPIILFALLAVALAIWQVFTVMAVAVVNGALVGVMITQPSRKGKAVARGNSRLEPLYDAEKYVPSKELQNKLDESEKGPEKRRDEAYAKELAAFEKKFNDKLKSIDGFLAEANRIVEEDSKVAKAAHAAALEQANALLPAAEEAVRSFDLLRDEDKTLECVAFLVDELKSGRSSTLKAALAAYDRHLENVKDLKVRLAFMQESFNHELRADREHRQEEERIRRINADTSKLKRENNSEMSAGEREIYERYAKSQK